MSVFFAVPFSIISQFSSVLRLLIATVQKLGRTSFVDPGTYPVTLTVSNGTEYLSHTGYITVEAPQSTAPVAGFSVSTDQGTAPLAVEFLDESSGDITSRQWAFGEVGSSSEVSPTYVFEQPGVYVVVLTVSGPAGVSQAERTITVTRSVTEVVADFAVSILDFQNPYTRVFDSSSSSGAIVRWEWDFNNDGVTDNTERNPSFTFQSIGTYDVTLTVIGGDGSTSSASQQVSIFDVQGPVADFDASAYEGSVPLMVDFNDTSLPTAFEIVSREWTFPDGSTSTSISPNYTFDIVGTFEVSLTVTDSQGLTSTQVKTITVSENHIHAWFEYSNGIIFVGNPISFYDRSWGKEPVTWLWEFGENNATSDEQNPSYLFTTPGRKSVRLTVTAADGEQHSVTRTIEVLAENEVRARFNCSPRRGVSTLTTNCSNNSIGQITSYLWDFAGFTFTDEIPAPFTFDSVGVYEISLTVYGPNGEHDTATRRVEVLPPLEVTMSAMPIVGTAPLRTDFSGIANGTVDTWRWERLDNGAVRYGRDVSFVFLQPGEYPVRLTASRTINSTLEQVSVEQTIRVFPSGNIRAAFRANTYYGIAPQEICFINLSTGQEPLSFEWDFDHDGVIDSTDREPCFTYNAEGQYQVTLIATNSTSGGQATTSVEIFDPSQYLININYEFYEPFGVCFYPEGDFEGATGWYWIMGDGTILTDDPNPCRLYSAPGTYRVSVIVQPPTGSPIIGWTDITIVAEGEVPPRETPESEPPPVIEPPVVLIVPELVPTVEPTATSSLEIVSEPTEASSLEVIIFATNTPRSNVLATSTPTTAEPTETTAPTSTIETTAELEQTGTEVASIIVHPIESVTVIDSVENSTTETTDGLLPIALLALVGVVVGVQIAASAQSSQCQQATIANTIIGLNLRSGPGRDYPILAAYPDGTNITACKYCERDDHVWMWVQVSDGRTGWMANHQVGGPLWATIDAKAVLPNDCSLATPPIDPGDPGDPGDPPPVTPPILDCSYVIDANNKLNNLRLKEWEAQNRYNQAATDANYWWDTLRWAEGVRNGYAAAAWNCASQIPSVTLRLARATAELAVLSALLAGATALFLAALAAEGAAWLAYQAAQFAFGWISEQWWGGWARPIIDAARLAYEAAKRVRENLQRQVEDLGRRVADKGREVANLGGQLLNLSACLVRNTFLAGEWLARTAYYRLRTTGADWWRDHTWRQWDMARNERIAAEQNLTNNEKVCRHEKEETPRPTSTDLGGFVFKTREQWGANPIKTDSGEGWYDPNANEAGYAPYSLLRPGESLSQVLSGVVIHHSDGYSGPKGIQDFHQGPDRKWADIAYHYVVEKDGTVNEGRLITARGTHVGGANTGRIGIVLLGDYEADWNGSDGTPPENQLQSVVNLITWLNATFGITEVKRHSDFGGTVCPGNQVNETHMQRFRAAAGL